MREDARISSFPPTHVLTLRRHASLFTAQESERPGDFAPGRRSSELLAEGSLRAALSLQERASEDPFFGTRPQLSGVFTSQTFLQA